MLSKFLGVWFLAETKDIILSIGFKEDFIKNAQDTIQNYLTFEHSGKSHTTEKRQSIGTEAEKIQILQLCDKHFHRRYIRKMLKQAIINTLETKGK